MGMRFGARAKLSALSDFRFLTRGETQRGKPSLGVKPRSRAADLLCQLARWAARWMSFIRKE